jgi:hypothetical protein
VLLEGLSRNTGNAVALPMRRIAGTLERVFGVVARRVRVAVVRAVVALVCAFRRGAALSIELRQRIVGHFCRPGRGRNTTRQVGVPHNVIIVVPAVQRPRRDKILLFVRDPQLHVGQDLLRAPRSLPHTHLGHVAHKIVDRFKPAAFGVFVLLLPQNDAPAVRNRGARRVCRVRRRASDHNPVFVEGVGADVSHHLARHSQVIPGAVRQIERGGILMIERGGVLITVGCGEAVLDELKFASRVEEQKIPARN